MRQKMLLAVLIAAAGFPGSGTLWAANTPINLLFLGDSITTTTYGHWQTPLTTKLTGNGYAPTILANEGHSGFIIQGAKDGAFGDGLVDSRPSLCLPDAPRSGLAENIDTYMNHSGVNADNSYILLMIGTNDVDMGFKLNSTDSPSAKTRLGNLITSITDLAPKAHLLVAQIVPLYDGGGNLSLDAKVQQFNVDVQASVTAAQAANKHVTMVDMYDPFHADLYPTRASNPYMADRWHPNDAGGAVIAQVWADGIQAASVPEPGTLALLGVGALSLAVHGWRSRKGRMRNANPCSPTAGR